LKPAVLHIIDSFDQGGTERQAIQLVSQLKQDGRFDVKLACLDSRGVLRSEVERLGLGDIPEYPLTSFYDSNTVKQLRSFVRFLYQSEIRLVHTHGFYTNMFGMVGAALARVPARVASRRETEGFRTPAQKRVERYTAFRLAHSVVANAESIRRQLIKDGLRASKVVTIYNGLDMTRVAPQMTKSEALDHFGLPQDRRFVTIIANVNHPVKDHGTLLRAMRRLRESLPDVACIVAGDGQLLEQYRDLAADLGIANEVYFIGRSQMIGDLLNVSYVCVLSSKAEGFSNSLLEYMAAARPVVVTDVGGAREAVIEDQNGYIVPAGDYETMAVRIGLLLRAPERARAMGARGSEIVQENFSCQAQLERTLTLYDRLLSLPIPKLEPALESISRERA